MKESYKDITSKLGTPIWWDEVGCPRYTPFKPGMTNDVYAKQAVLFRIQCQACRQPFDVCLSWGEHLAARYSRPVFDLKKRVKDTSLHYGDPPDNGCCVSGPTMNCDDIRVIEFWELVKFDWVRHPELEVDLRDVKLECVREDLLITMQLFPKPRNETVITYFGKPCKVACDRNCGKAWGFHSRPKAKLSENPDDYAFLADTELGDAPSDPGTWEGGDGKPQSPDDFPNKWCIRECERCAKSKPGKHTDPIELKSFQERRYNIPRATQDTHTPG